MFKTFCHIIWSSHLELCLLSSQINIPFLPKFLFKLALRCLPTSLSTWAYAKTTRALTLGWSTWRHMTFSTKRARTLFPRVVQLQIPGLLQMPASSDLLPPDLVLPLFTADIACFGFKYIKGPYPSIP